jgi:serine/threonine protein kinase
MPTTTGIRRRLSPALLAGAPYRVGDRMGERYLVKDAIGVGPLGYVFRAEDEQQGIDVAVKMIHPRFVQTGEERQLFARTLEPARKFLQPSLARVHDIGVDQGWPYVTYSFLDGLTLRRMVDSRLAKGQTFTLEEVEPFLGQMAAALEAAHPLGAHGDLKPENVVILPDMLRIIDWGMACGLPRLPFAQAQRQKSAHRYLAPEYVAGGEVDPRADLYALGVLVGEMLTGLTPDEEIPELRLTAPELPEAVEGFYRRALNEKPEARFRSVRDLYEEFLTLLGGAGEPAAADSQPTVESEVVKVDEVLTEQGVSQGRPEEVVPIPAAELPRFDGNGGWEPARPSSREVMALEPPEWSAPASDAAARPAGGKTESGRWQALRLWDADEGPQAEEADRSNGVEPHGAAGSGAEEDQASSAGSPGSQEEASARPGSDSAVSELDAAADLARVDERLSEQADPIPGSELAASAGPDSEAADAAGSDSGSTPAGEPLLDEALGVDLVVEPDEPAPAAAAAVLPSGNASLPAPRRKSDPLVPWLTGPRAVPHSRELPASDPRSGESGHPAPPSIAPLAAVASGQAAVAAPMPTASPRPSSRIARGLPGSLPAAPSRAPVQGAVTPQAQPPEPSPRHRELAESSVSEQASAERARSAGPPGQARGAGSWSPAELLAQVIAEVQAEERAVGQEQASTWEPLPLDATQPVSSDEVAARLALEPAAHAIAGMDPTPPAFTARALAAAVVHPQEEEDLPARRHEAGRAGRRMALLIAAGLILGMLGQYGLMKLLQPKPQPQAARISAVQSAEMPAPPSD